MCEGTENGIGNEDENNTPSVNGGDLIEEHAVKADLKAETDGGVDKPPSWFQPQNHKTRLLQFHGSKYAAGLRNDIQVCKINALALNLTFWPVSKFTIVNIIQHLFYFFLGNKKGGVGCAKNP